MRAPQTKTSEISDVSLCCTVKLLRGGPGRAFKAPGKFMPSEEMSRRVGCAGRWLLLGSSAVQDLDLFVLLDPVSRLCSVHRSPWMITVSTAFLHIVLLRAKMKVIQGDTTSLILKVISTEGNCKVPPS